MQSLSESRFRVALWRYPESWVWVISAVCWLLVLTPAATPAHEHLHHAGPDLSLLAFHWLPMIFAMMAPLQFGQLRLIAARSIWRRRHLAMALYLCGYLLPWLSFGFLVWASSTFWPMPLSFWLAVGAMWQLTPWKRSAALACHRTRPLAPHGWSANRDCLLSGFYTGNACLATCWAMMMACGLHNHSAWLMLILTCLMWAERLLGRSRQFRYAIGLAALALLTALVGR